MFVNARIKKNRIGKEYYGQTNPKLIWLDVILEIMYGGKMGMPLGGSIMVWGCFSANGTGNLSVISGRMNATSKYFRKKLNFC